MAQICKVCTHPERQAIDAELSRDWERSLRAIGTEFGLSKDTIFRHAQRHLPQAPEEPEGAEPRQMAEVVEEEKELDPPNTTNLFEEMARLLESLQPRA